MDAAANETAAGKMAGDSDTGANLVSYHDAYCSFGTYGVLLVVALFQFINWVIKTVGPPKSLRDDEWKWRNLTISWLHALACSLWCFASFITDPGLLWDLQYYKTTSIIFLVTFSSGYFLYDFLDLALNGKMVAMWEVQLHHIAVGSIFYYNLVNCEWLAFNVIALTVEVNSFFLHQRKLLQMLGTPYSSTGYRITIFLNICTFVVFRGIPLLAISWAMVEWYHRVSLPYYLCLAFSMFVMVVMNPILFMRLLRSDYLRGRSKAEGGRGGKPSAVVNGNNNYWDGARNSHLKSS